jgi:uncharacterized membrane protein YhaH (DUF805 family)
MPALRVLFSPSGRLAPWPFMACAVAVYLGGVAAQALTLPDVLSRFGLWPFAIAQPVLIWLWFVVHAKRLHDAGSPVGLAIGASILYGLSVVLLLIIAAAFFAPSGDAIGGSNGTSALGLILLLAIVATLAGSSSYDLGWLMVLILLVLACLPLLIAMVVTLWAATRPRRKAVDA